MNGFFVGLWISLIINRPHWGVETSWGVETKPIAFCCNPKFAVTVENICFQKQICMIWALSFLNSFSADL